MPRFASSPALEITDLDFMEGLSVLACCAQDLKLSKGAASWWAEDLYRLTQPHSFVFKEKEGKPKMDA